jgi:hypothetical protein
VSERESREATARVLVTTERGAAPFFAPTSVPVGQVSQVTTGLAGDKRETKPLHYKVICISMYTDDLKRLDTMVESLKARGLTKANRSALIRYALSEVNLERVPKGL